MDIGTKLGHYEIIDRLGAGGMGEVYRARDTKLKREVALKLLPEDLATNPERLGHVPLQPKQHRGDPHSLLPQPLTHDGTSCPMTGKFDLNRPSTGCVVSTCHALRTQL